VIAIEGEVMGASGKGEGPEVAQMELEVEEGGGGEEPASQPFASQQHVISAELLQAVLAAKSDVAGVAILADNLVGSEWDHSDIARSRGMIAAEFAYLNIAFAKEKGFTSDQALAFVRCGLWCGDMPAGKLTDGTHFHAALCRRYFKKVSWGGSMVIW
jgi:hypothetical protein